MCKPFALFNQLGLRSERHKVSLDDQVGVLFAEEERRSARARLGGTFRGSFIRHGGGQCWRVGHGGHALVLLGSGRLRVLRGRGGSRLARVLLLRRLLVALVGTASESLAADGTSKNANSRVRGQWQQRKRMRGLAQERYAQGTVRGETCSKIRERRGLEVRMGELCQALTRWKRRTP